MVFVSVPYRLSADEITTVGSDTYVTGTRIHDASRDAVFGSVLATVASDAPISNGQGPVWLVREQYLRTLAPIDAGERVGILVSLEAAGISAVHVCVRVIHGTGGAVACGFQTIACFSRNGEEMPLPLAVFELRRAHGEPAGVGGAGSFAARAVAGGPSVASLFPDDILALGARVAVQDTDAQRDDAPVTVAPRSPGGPDVAALRSSVIFRASVMLRPSVVTAEMRTGQFRATGASRHSGLFGTIPEFVAPVVAGRGVAFVFPGSDSYDGQLLRELCAALPYLSTYVGQADVIARRHFRTGFFGLIDADSLAEHDEHLRRCPELSHFGTFLTGVLFAEALQERGVWPDILVGHGLGELSALAAAGAFDVDTGFQIIAHRILALRTMPDASSSTTLSGAAAQQFERSISRLKFRSPRAQVYSPIEGGLYAADATLPPVLASRLLGEPQFAAAVRALRRAGCEYFVECGAGGLTRVIGEILSSKPAQTTPAAPERKNLAAKLTAASKMLAGRPGPGAATPPAIKPERIGERAGLCPVAITGIGCVFPGAADLDAYWRNVLDGVSGISEHETFATEVWDTTGLSERGDVIASASVDQIEHDPRLPFTAAEFEQLTRAQQLLALALRECTTQRQARPATPRRVRCFLGASAEGLREYEEGSLIDRVREMLAGLDEPKALRDTLTASLDELAASPGVDVNTSSPCAGIGAMVERVVGAPADVMLVDAACASSLYAIDLAMKSLRTMDSDLVIVGGVFTPGASWQPLYALFEGLLGSGSFPFEQRADGVVFGEGAALLMLKRLPDAMDGGNRIHGVIRSVGLSCDGKKASVSEPNAAGQVLAMRRAYENAGVDVGTVQFIEGHGVSNPASDAAELDALRTVFTGTESTLSPRPLESVKALVGHTVWAAGAASVVKVCRALEEHIVPPQQDFVVPNPAAHLEASGLQIPPSPRSWPANADGEPRRAGVSAFGLGGTNAHAVVEAMSHTYHRRLADRMRAELPRTPMAVVSIAGMFASSDESVLIDLPGASPGALRRSAVRSTLPAELRPEVVDQLDMSQLLSVAGVEKALAGLANWQESRKRTGVVAGMVGRTARALAASERVYRDELRRLLTTHFSELGIESGDAERVARTLYEMTGASTAPVTPHTLMGLLPNIAAARVGSMFDLQGPNLVIDAGGRSVLEVLDAAERWLTCGTADVMLACMLRLDARRRADDRAREAGGEGALVLALTTRAFARERGWTILGELAVGARGGDSIVAQPANATRAHLDVMVPSTRPLAGMDELAYALDAMMRGGTTAMRWEREVRGAATAPPRDGVAPVMNRS